MDTLRRQPYLWVTWIVGLLSGDKSCEWAAWLKAHYTYDKINDESSDLSQWKSDHADMVRARCAQLEQDGWLVSLESQNKFTWRGKSATLGGQPDIIAERGLDVRVEDCKTGRSRDSDYWQVVLYMLALPATSRPLRDRVISGAVIYRDHVREIEPDAVKLGTENIVKRIRAAAGEAEPKRTPSQSECSRCDIASCQERIHGGDLVAVDTDIF